MKFTFAFILFYLMLSVLTFKLKKKIQKTKKVIGYGVLTFILKKLEKVVCMMQIAIHIIV